MNKPNFVLEISLFVGNGAYDSSSNQSIDGINCYYFAKIVKHGIHVISLVNSGGGGGGGGGEEKLNNKLCQQAISHCSLPSSCRIRIICSSTFDEI